MYVMKKSKLLKELVQSNFSCDDLNQVVKYLESISYSFNAVKTKTVLFDTRQMLRTRHLNDPDLNGISVNGNPIKRAYIYKILVVTFGHDLSWNLHSKPNFEIIRLLSRINKLTPFHFRKQLAESLSSAKSIHNDPNYIKKNKYKK